MEKRISSQRVSTNEITSKRSLRHRKADKMSPHNSQCYISPKPVIIKIYFNL